MIEKAIKTLKKVIRNSYSPYSKFKVASAVITDDGTIYTGVNIENSSYGLTICAERVAVFKAVSEGKTKIKTVIVYTPTEEHTFPCGACRQVISEFNPKAEIIVVNKKGEIKKHYLNDLLPHTFTGERLLSKRK